MVPNATALPLSDHRYARQGTLYRVARPRTRAGHHDPALPVADAARPHRLEPSASRIGLAVQRGGARRLRRRAVARPSHVFLRRLGGSIPNTPVLQEAFGQPKGQQPGCSFPVVRLLGLLPTRVVAPLLTHDLARCRRSIRTVKKGMFLELIGACVLMLTWPPSPKLTCMPCGASAHAEWESPAWLALGHARCAVDPSGQRPHTIMPAQRGWAPLPTRGRFKPNTCTSWRAQETWASLPGALML
jgi:hypothetical protein